MKEVNNKMCLWATVGHAIKYIQSTNMCVFMQMYGFTSTFYSLVSRIERKLHETYFTCINYFDFNH